MPLTDIAAELISALIITGTSFTVGYSIRHHRRTRRRRLLKSLLGIDHLNPLLIIHSSIYDARRQSYNYPASDLRASKSVTLSLNAAGFREDSDYRVFAESEVDKINLDEDPLWAVNLLLFCGPKRNKLVARALTMLGGANYSMTTDNETSENVLLDERRGTVLVSSRDRGDEPTESPGKTPIRSSQYDYGYLASFSNPRSTGCRITIAAGIHGPGTVGAAEFLTVDANLSELLRRARSGVISEVVKVTYKAGSPDDVIQVQLV